MKIHKDWLKTKINWKSTKIFLNGNGEVGKLKKKKKRRNDANQMKCSVYKF